MSKAGILKELCCFLVREKKWWLVPVAAVLVLTALCVFFGQSVGVTPFIYTLF